MERFGGDIIKTYQDLEAAGASEKDRMDFIQSVVSDHKNGKEYKIASDAELYYAKKNPTILKFQKFIYNSLGQSVPDVWSSNYKLTHGFFRRFVLQQVQYVLSNGVTFQKPETKTKLGPGFDAALQNLAKKAMVDGVCFGFWNYDHLEVFPMADTKNSPGFAQIPDQDTGKLRAGVRYWSIGDQTERYTLYEESGYTEYIRRNGEDMTVLREKTPYKVTKRENGFGNVEEISGENYARFPIVQMYANDLKESEIIGIRPSIDCYDFIMSGLANNVDETSAFYWILSGTGGMDDVDLVNFVNRMKQIRATVIDRGMEAEAHTLEVPVDANKVLLDYLKSDMYEDMMLMNPEKILGGNLVATAIRFAYQPQDDKCGDFEYCIREFIGSLLELLEIEDEPSFQWNRVANQMEETQMVMLAASEMDSESILRHLPWLTPEEVDEIMERRASEDLNRFRGTKRNEQQEDENAGV